jgi:hypothetical protein
MIINPVNIGKLVQVHIDDRRSIFECNLPTSSIQQISFNKAIPLGNHFHKEKEETFFVMESLWESRQL